MKTFRILLAFLAIAIPAVVFGQVGVSISIGPPALPVYEQPVCPGDGYIWTPGYWAYDDSISDYYWVDGAWVLAPEEGYLWTPGYWGWNSFSGVRWVTSTIGEPSATAALRAWTDLSRPTCSGTIISGKMTVSRRATSGRSPGARWAARWPACRYGVRCRVGLGLRGLLGLSHECLLVAGAGHRVGLVLMGG